MRKCMDCAEENLNESLFCKQCGSCLLAPDPKMVLSSRAVQPEHAATQADLNFYDGQMVRPSVAYNLKRKHQPRSVVIEGWLLLVNSVVFVLMLEIVRYMVAE